MKYASRGHDTKQKQFLDSHRCRAHVRPRSPSFPPIIRWWLTTGKPHQPPHARLPPRVHKVWNTFSPTWWSVKCIARGRSTSAIPMHNNHPPLSAPVIIGQSPGECRPVTFLKDRSETHYASLQEEKLRLSTGDVLFFFFFLPWRYWKNKHWNTQESLVFSLRLIPKNPWICTQSFQLIAM